MYSDDGDFSAAPIHDVWTHVRSDAPQAATHYKMGGTAWNHFELPGCNGLGLSQQDTEMTRGEDPGIMQYNVARSCHKDAASTEPSVYRSSSFEDPYRMMPSETTMPSTCEQRANDLHPLSDKASFSEDGYSSPRSSIGAGGFASLNLLESLQDEVLKSQDRSFDEELDSCMMDGLDSRANPITIPNLGNGQDDCGWRPEWDEDAFHGAQSSSYGSANAFPNSLPTNPVTVDLRTGSDAGRMDVANPNVSHKTPNTNGQLLNSSGPTQDNFRVRPGEGSTSRYDFELSSTYPPTEGFWPPHNDPLTPNKRSSRPCSSGSLPLIPRSTSLKLPSAKKASTGRNRALSDRARPPVPSKKLSIVYEQCEFANTHAVAVADPHRAIRRGPLTQVQREQAAENRREKLVCIRCKRLKVSCPGGIPCERCLKNSNAGPWGICTLFHFFSIVDAGSLNYISQRTVNHPTLDGTRRMTLQLPEVLDLDQLLSFVTTRSHAFNVVVRQGATFLYSLDLGKSSRFLAELRSRCPSSMIEVRELVDKLLPKTKGGLSCVSARVLPAELLYTQACWNNMPSRVTYEKVQKDSGAARIFNVEDPADQVHIKVAAQLSRIVSRALEIEAFAHLQAQMSDLVLRESQGNIDIESLVHNLGRILLTLRWRMAWWKRFGDGSSGDVFRDKFVDRVQSLLRILYFYYMYAFKRMPHGTDLRSFKGVRSVYADANSIFEKLPHDESFEGFRAWLDQGEEIIKQAGVVDYLSRSRT